MLVLDVDGVLTDGSIFYTDGGEELKSFMCATARAEALSSLGKRAGIITGRRSANCRTARKGIDIAFVAQGVSDKKVALVQVLADAGVKAEQTCVMGDDIVDLPMLRTCGLAVAVADACPEAKEDADYVTEARGGRGAVRETIEMILRAQGSWQALVARYREI